jgi:uncharacterized protein (DUF1501 family)
MKRRQFIQSGSMMTLPLMLGGLEVSAMTRSSLFQFAGEKEGNVLVLIQMNGGNDGLNMVIPLDQYDGLSVVRKTIMIPENDVLKMVTKTGLHPSMGGLHNLYTEGELAVVQSVGYPNQNRSHFRSTDIWTTGSSYNKYLKTGWMGRYFDENFDGYPEDYPNAEHPDPFAITLGSLVSETCQGDVANYSFTLVNKTSVKLVEETVAAPTSNSCYSKKLTDIHSAIKQSNAYASTVLNAFDKGSNLATYPTGNRLAEQLKVVANLISGGLKTKIYVVNLGGFDTHANQVEIGETGSGDHANLLKSVSDAVASFAADCKSLGIHEKVMGMTFSEFGRQIKANNSYGTDHGTAAPLFVFGSCVKQGVYGHNPEISATVSDQEGVPMQHDFRSIYGTLLVDWLGANETQVKNVLFGDFQRIPFVKDCSISSINPENLDIEVSLYPNPTADKALLTFDHPGGNLSITVLDSVGSLVQLTTSKYVGRGTQRVPIVLNDLPAGVYFVRLVSDRKIKTLRIVKS